MMAAAKERIPWSEGPSVALPLAAAVTVAKNSRPGFEPKKINSHPGWSEVNFKTVSGIGVSLRRDGIRSRCQSLNRYAYVINNPTTLVDPKGLQGQPPAGTTCGHGGPPIPFGQNPATYCYNHMPLGWGIMAGTIGWLPGSSEDAIAGNDIFDAISGAPRNVLDSGLTRKHGLWVFGAAVGPNVEPDRPKNTQAFSKGGLDSSSIPTAAGYTVVQRNFGTFTETSGLIPDINAAQQSQNQVLAMLPGATQNVILAQVSSGLSMGNAMNATMGTLKWQNPGLYSAVNPYYIATLQQGNAVGLEVVGFFGGAWWSGP